MIEVVVVVVTRLSLGPGGETLGTRLSEEGTTIASCYSKQKDMKNMAVFVLICFFLTPWIFLAVWWIISFTITTERQNMYNYSLPQELHVSYTKIPQYKYKQNQTHKENYCYLDIKVNEKGSSGKNLVCSER